MLDRVGFTVDEGQVVSVVGPSGCGKTTLLHILSGLTNCDSGEVRYGPGVAEQCTLVFQQHGLFPWKTVYDNVRFGLNRSREPDEELILPALHAFGLEEFASHWPHQLSAGLCQRASLARALVSSPRLLLMDEPFSALDAQTTMVIRERFLEQQQLSGAAAVVVTHDIEEAILLGDRVVVFSPRPGSIIEIINVPLPKPRIAAGTVSSVVAEMRQHIWQLLEADIRREVIGEHGPRRVEAL